MTIFAGVGREVYPGKKEMMDAWTAFMAEDKGNVTLLAFDGTILERVSSLPACRSPK